MIKVQAARIIPGGFSIFCGMDNDRKFFFIQDN